MSVSAIDLLDEQPRARAAHFALVEIDPVDDALDRLVERRVVEHDVRGLATELQRHGLVGSATPRPILRPISVEPVNATLSTFGWVARCIPISPGPVTMFTVPGGRSAWTQTSANSSADSGVVEAGLSTTVFPAASAARSSRPASAAGSSTG